MLKKALLFIPILVCTAGCPGGQTASPTRTTGSQSVQNGRFNHLPAFLSIVEQLCDECRDASEASPTQQQLPAVLASLKAERASLTFDSWAPDVSQTVEFATVDFTPNEIELRLILSRAPNAQPVVWAFPTGL
jgi:hypothetical protein